MSDAYISTRCKKLLYMVISTNDYVSLQQISEELKLSKRSIYYEICKINDWLLAQGITEIEIVRGKGIRFSDEIKRQIENAMESEDTNETYIFSPMERIYFIICFIIKSSQEVSVEQLSERLQVSRNTIFNDMRVVVKQLQDYDLHLEYESKKGYHIKGDCIRIRALFILYFNMLRPLYESGALRYIDKDSVKENLRKLKEIETRLNTDYVDGTLLSVAVLIPLMEENNSELYFPNLKRDELKECQEYKLIEEYFPKLEENEQIYLCLHLLGSRVSMSSVEMFDDNSVQSNYEMAKALVGEFEKVACVIFEDREALERALYFHLNSSMYRFQYGIQVGNPMLKDIVREYPELFDLTKVVTHYLEQQIGLPIADGEVAYLALHFGAHLKKVKKENERIRVLIVCSNGISAGNMIKHELLKMLPQIDVVGVISAKEAINVQKICDVVISTIKMNCLVPVILVHPILTDFDRKVILNHSIFKNLNGNVDVDELFNRIKKYIPEKNRVELKKELLDFFENSAPNVQTIFDKNKKGLLEMLSDRDIAVEKERFTWEGALKQTGQVLVTEEKITTAYIDNIVEQTKHYGPYMFITKEVVLAHAKPENGVLEMGVSLSIYKEPVIFSDFHQAKIIIMIAAIDQEKHLGILKDIMTIFSVEDNAKKMAELNDKKEVIEFLEKILLKAE